MKNWLRERANSVIFDTFYSVFVGSFAEDQWANKYLILCLRKPTFLAPVLTVWVPIATWWQTVICIFVDAWAVDVCCKWKLLSTWTIPLTSVMLKATSKIRTLTGARTPPSLSWHPSLQLSLHCSHPESQASQVKLYEIPRPTQISLGSKFNVFLGGLMWGILTNIDLSKPVTESLTPEDEQALVDSVVDAYGVSPNDVVVDTSYQTSGTVDVDTPFPVGTDPK